MLSSLWRDTTNRILTSTVRIKLSSLIEGLSALLAVLYVIEICEDSF
jgi:hypothetical protein